MATIDDYTWRQVTGSDPGVYQRFSMVWAGDKTILFGGEAAVAPFKHDETWKFQDETWTQLFPSTPPAARSFGAIAYNDIDSYVLLYGGLDTAGSVLNDTWKFDLFTEEWTQLSPANTPSANSIYFVGPYSMVWDGTQFILQTQRVVSSLFVPETWVFDGTDWTQLSPTNEVEPFSSNNGRCWPALAYGDGNTYLVGGSGSGSILPLPDPATGATWIYDGSDWTKLAVGCTPNTFPHSDIPHTDYALSWAPLAYGTSSLGTLHFGGHRYDLGEVGARKVVDYTWILESGGWRKLTFSTYPTKRSFHGLVFDATLKRWILYGGFGELGSDTRFDTWVLEPPVGISIEKTPDSQEISSGDTANFTITVTNTGEGPLTDVEVTDALVPGCASVIGYLTEGDSVEYSCSIDDVTEDFTNTIEVTGSSGSRMEEASDTAEVVLTSETPTVPEYHTLSRRVNYKGQWDIGSAYVVGDAVTHNRETFLCIQTNTGQEPDDS